MITYHDVEIPARAARTVLEEHELLCDLCGSKTDVRSPWVKDRFDAVEVEVRLREGESYPEGGHGSETIIDLCPTCFKEKLIPWVQDQGGKVRTKEWDW
jgi:hypothetical protein